MLEFDEQIAARLEDTYRTPDVVEQRRGVREALAVQPGEWVLDVGVGPGFLAAELAQEGARVSGIDVSDSMLAIAARRDSPTPLELGRGEATALPFGDSSFDAVVSTQVYEYVPDLDRALAEAHRVLRPGGRLLVLDTDWDSIVWHSSDPERMRRVLAAWEEHLADPYLPRTLAGRLRETGFQLRHLSAMPILSAGYDPRTLNGGLAPIIAAFVTGRRGIEPAEATAWLEDVAALGDDAFFSLNRYLFVAVR